MVEEGSLPVDELCPLSLRPADETLVVRVDCEKSWVRSSDGDEGDAFLFGLLFGVIGSLLMRPKRDHAEHLGRDTTVDLPIRIAGEARSRYRRRSRKQLISMLKRIPIYAELFEEFPDAKLKVLKPYSL